jgi:peroxiredoxin
MQRRTFFTLSFGWACSTARAKPARTYAYPNGLKLKAGEPILEFDLPKLDGGRITSWELKGAPTVITFFFSDCAPCIRDVPALNAFKAKNQNLNVLALTFDQVSRAARFKREHGLTWPIAVDAQPYFEKIGARAFPQFTLLDGEGTVLSSTYGRELGDDRGTVILSGLESWVQQFLPKQ